AQYRAELDYAKTALARVTRLRARGAASEDDVREVEKRCQVYGAQQEQAQAEKQARQALGTQHAEEELAKRDKELADARAALTLMEAGSRREEIDAERARLARLREEARYLDGLQNRLRVRSPVAGLITTAHLKEKIGHYVREGELICVVEEPAGLE